MKYRSLLANCMCAVLGFVLLSACEIQFNQSPIPQREQLVIFTGKFTNMFLPCMGSASPINLRFTDRFDEEYLEQNGQIKIEELTTAIFDAEFGTWHVIEKEPVRIPFDKEIYEGSGPVPEHTYFHMDIHPDFPLKPYHRYQVTVEGIRRESNHEPFRDMLLEFAICPDHMVRQVDYEPDEERGYVIHSSKQFYYSEPGPRGDLEEMLHFSGSEDDIWFNVFRAPERGERAIAEDALSQRTTFTKNQELRIAEKVTCVVSRNEEGEICEETSRSRLNVEGQTLRYLSSEGSEDGVWFNGEDVITRYESVEYIPEVAAYDFMNTRVVKQYEVDPTEEGVLGFDGRLESAMLFTPNPLGQQIQFFSEAGLDDNEEVGDEGDECDSYSNITLEFSDDVEVLVFLTEHFDGVGNRLGQTRTHRDRVGRLLRKESWVVDDSGELYPNTLQIWDYEKGNPDLSLAYNRLLNRTMIYQNDDGREDFFELEEDELTSSMTHYEVHHHLSLGSRSHTVYFDGAGEDGVWFTEDDRRERLVCYENHAHVTPNGLGPAPYEPHCQFFIAL